MKKQFLLACTLFTIFMAIGIPTIYAQAIQQKTVATLALPNQFTGQPAGADAVLLAWKQTNETDILYFELQRSTDSTSFTSILLMQAKGAIKKPNGYTLTDTNLSSRYHYYRLRIENFDGKETYSAIIPVRLQTSNTLQTQTARL